MDEMDKLVHQANQHEELVRATLMAGVFSGVGIRLTESTTIEEIKAIGKLVAMMADAAFDALRRTGG
jgi:hypothetical protein